MDVAIVIPALDEELSLPGVLADVPAEFAARVVVVDNGSRDRTAQVARGAGAEVVREPRRGYGAACLAGLAHLAARPPDVVAFLDADHSNDPRELPALLAPLAAGADLAIGSRVLGRREEGSLTSLQVFGNALAAGLMRVAFGARVTDLGPFRAIRWPALQRLGMRDRDYGWTVEMQARAFREGLSVAEVPVRTWRRRVGSSKVSGTLRGAFGAGTKILFTIARVRLGG
ncbi:MAG TPA: glycosyltransferase family 2 protein [Candidatus Saccharimonadaceae bacterium]|jgi:glycosyltransferase involved in cell wall biosynthesis|nr:glycosyltransferase family 2 protein [Candidatus Saccharimonadaceae bacterium]